ncbi:TVP38/TMEM64 family protein [Humisphaera borealis]|uniref:TVP38/TMEM64 family membrane protein n=1 Tax=Humisphaera borealis TaxID=2807512 RepID=A0A7M2X5U7_9BACT|nr:VTT domain-containing protein [Humisphaera borealis]QOV92180.1 TVP38/TMEM64 family protein [Humisphaera borealis]
MNEPAASISEGADAIATTAVAVERAVSPAAARVRLVILCLLTVAVIAASIWLFGTAQGRRLLDREHLAALGDSARQWVQANPLSFLLMFVVAYIVCAVLLLPVWWLQIISGFAFGIVAGIGSVMLGSTTGALATAAVSSWLGEDFVRSRIIGDGKGARRLNKAIGLLGRNGLLVVFICRLSYPIPYGVSNYLFGLTGIKRRDIAIGTALGGVPVYAGWVAAGARPDWVSRWQFWVIVVGINLLLLTPLVLRSFRRSESVDGRSGTDGPK